MATPRTGRPQYENRHHRRQERDFIGLLEGVFSCKIHKIPYRYKVDAFGTVEGKGRFWFELKQRRTPYDPYMISIRKLWAGTELARVTGCPFYLCLRYPERDYSLKVTPRLLRTLPTGVGGRKDRDDSGDIEPVYFIGLDRFDRITL